MKQYKQYTVSDENTGDVMGTATIYDIGDLLRANFVLNNSFTASGKYVSETIDELVSTLRTGGFTKDLEDELGIVISDETSFLTNDGENDEIYACLFDCETYTKCMIQDK